MVKKTSMNQSNTSSNNPNMSSTNKNINSAKPEQVGMVKLPKVSTIGSSNVSNTSVKAIW